MQPPHPVRGDLRNPCFATDSLHPFPRPVPPVAPEQQVLRPLPLRDLPKIFVMELEDVARSYEQIVAPNPSRCIWGPDVGAALERLANSYRTRSCRPVLLAFAKSRPQEMDRAARLCESITVRYSVVGEKNPSHLERMYGEMAQILRQEADPWKRFSEASLFDEIPDDDEFRLKFTGIEVSTVTPGWREVLFHLNQSLGGGELRVDRPGRVHIEHILPQSPRAAVLTEAGLSPDRASKLINRVGNLTLLSSRRNQELSNRPFPVKAKVYARSDVYLTRELASIERWGEEEIEQRSRRLAAAAVDLFPHPKKIAC